MEVVIDNIELNNEGKNHYKRNPKYHSLTMKIYRVSKKLDKSLDLLERKTLFKELKRLRSLRRTMKSIIPNDEVLSIRYVRYADD